MIDIRNDDFALLSFEELTIQHGLKHLRASTQNLSMSVYLFLLSLAANQYNIGKFFLKEYLK